MALSDGKTPAIFVDRDGVICENRPDHVKSWSEFVFVDGAVEALASLTRAKQQLFVVTNQAAVGRGLLSRRGLDAIHEKMLEFLGGAGARIESILVCPHHPQDDCACRKPKPGLLVQASDRFKVDLSNSFVIGDHKTDLEAGTLAGCETILVKTGRGLELARSRDFGGNPPTFIADDLVDAAIWILARRAQRVGGRSRQGVRLS